MSELEYPACIRELYESEIFGEAAALALFEAARNDRERHHFGTLLQLETETKARLRPFLRKYDMTLSEKMDLSDVDETVTGYRAGSWEEFIGGLLPVVQSFLARFKEIAEACPAEDEAIVDSMVHHESAILKWLELEKAGATESSLDGIIEQLQHPLPKV